VPNIEIYNLLILFLELLENNKESINELRWGYLIKSLSILGYIPSLDKCSNCGKNLIKNIYISSRDGWIFCYECMEHKIDKKISVGAINFLNIVLRNDYKEIIKIKVSNTVKNDLEEFFNSIIIGILGKGLKSEKMLKSI
jgi:DNA repair protein RecO (recombination protein O)